MAAEGVRGVSFVDGFSEERADASGVSPGEGETDGSHEEWREQRTAAVAAPPTPRMETRRAAGGGQRAFEFGAERHNLLDGGDAVEDGPVGGGAQ